MGNMTGGLRTQLDRGSEYEVPPVGSRTKLVGCTLSGIGVGKGSDFVDLHDCKIRRADEGVFAHGSSTTIVQCNISSCYIGVRVESSLEAIDTKVHHNTASGLSIHERVKHVCWSGSKCFSNRDDVRSGRRLLEGWSFRGIGPQKRNSTTTQRSFASVDAKSEVREAALRTPLGAITS